MREFIGSIRRYSPLEREIGAEEMEKFVRFFELVITENKKFNLTAITDPQEAAILHFADSLSAGKVEAFLAAKTVLDIGSGAGFPGIPLAIVFPEKKFFLIESLGKKAQFLTTVARELDLRNVKILPMRAEDVGRDEKYRGKADLVTARAVAELRVLAEYALPLLRMGGTFLAMKGAQYTEELSAAVEALEILGGSVAEVHPYNLGAERQYVLIEIRKDRETGEKYPRRAGIPVKRPLGK